MSSSGSLAAAVRSFRRAQLLLPPLCSSSSVMGGLQVPRCCTTSSQPVPAARLPYRVKVTAGKRYAWCACGHSKKQPYCDGAHKSKAPSIAPLRFTPDRDQTLLLCACKHTKNAPYCDGSHFGVLFRDAVKSLKGLFK